MTSCAFASVLSRARRLRDAREGSAAVEFAIVAPVVVMFIVGTVMLGLAFHTASTIQWSFERSVRMAMIDADVTLEEIKAAMAEDLARLGSPEVELSYAIDETGHAPLAVNSADFAVPLNIPFLPELSLRYNIETVAPLPDA